MCCLYYFDAKTREAVERMTGVRGLPELDMYRDIHPSDRAVILTGRKPGLQAEAMRWGILNSRKQLMINARAETALEKTSFHDSVLRRRCIIPAAHFYEWDADKNRAAFTWENSPVLYMAGFYNLSENEERFTIITTEANDSMRSIHDRMPLILPEEQIKDWIYDDMMIKDILKQPSPMLTKYQEYEQLTLW